MYLLDYTVDPCMACMATRVGIDDDSTTCSTGVYRDNDLLLWELLQINVGCAFFLCLCVCVFFFCGFAATNSPPYRLAGLQDTLHQMLLGLWPFI